MFEKMWPNLPAESVRIFDREARLLERKRGEFVYQQGDEPAGLFFVEQGLVGLTLIGAGSGKEHLLRFFRSGQFFGHRSLFANEGYHGATLALEPTKIRMIPKKAALEVMEAYPQLYRDMALVLAKELRRCEMQHVMILENQILPRTALSLVYLKDLKPDHLWTRQEIANFCASTTSTIIKAMAELEAMGLIRQEGRQIEILDRQGLIDLQDFEVSK